MSASPNSGEKATPALIHVKGQAVARTNIFQLPSTLKIGRGKGNFTVSAFCTQSATRKS